MSRKLKEVKELKMILCQFMSNSLVRNHLTLYGFRQNSTSIEKMYKLRHEHILIFCKEVNQFGADKDSAKVLYVDGDGILKEGYIKYKNSKFCNNGYLRKLNNQIHNFKSANINFTTRDITLLLSNGNEKSYTECFYNLINFKINQLQTRSADYKKLYNYWKNNCYSNDDHYKNQIGDRYIDIHINYELIRNDKKALHKELKKMFKLFNKSI